MKWESVGRIIATIGLIVLLILGAWGIIIIAFDAPSFFSGVGSTFSSWFGTSTSTPATSTSTSTPQGGAPTGGSAETLVANVASSTAVSGQPFTISWSEQNALGPRSYLVAWRCTSGVMVEALLPNNTYRSVPCNTGFDYTNAQSQMNLRARLTGTKPVDLELGVAAISLATGSSTARADTMATVVPAGKTTTPAAKQPSVSYNQTSPKGYVTSNPYGTPDLQVRIVSIGYIDPSTTRFIALPANYDPNNNYSYQTMAVQFDIKNVGTKTVPGGWQFTASLPSNPVYTYTSQPQRALTPQSGTVYTLTWSNPSYNNCSQYQTYPYQNSYPYQNQCPPNYEYNQYSYNQQTVTITADPYNTTGDANRSNNTSTISF